MFRLKFILWIYFELVFKYIFRWVYFSTTEENWFNTIQRASSRKNNSPCLFLLGILLLKQTVNATLYSNWRLLPKTLCPPIDTMFRLFGGQHLPYLPKRRMRCVMKLVQQQLQPQLATLQLNVPRSAKHHSQPVKQEWPLQRRYRSQQWKDLRLARIHALTSECWRKRKCAVLRYASIVCMCGFASCGKKLPAIS